MIGAAARSRLFDLRRTRSVAQRSAELLEKRRQALLGELARREAQRGALRKRVEQLYEVAHSALRVAQASIGTGAVAASAVAQPTLAPFRSSTAAVIGVRVEHLELALPAYRACYSAAATNADVDRAGQAFLRLIGPLCDLAAQESALRRLQRVMKKTTRLVAALQKVVLPAVNAQIRAILDGIEEEERDEFARRHNAIAPNRFHAL